MDKNYNFNYQALETSGEKDALNSLLDHNLFAITSETDGKIIAYAVGLNHAHAIVTALEEAGGRYEIEMASSR